MAVPLWSPFTAPRKSWGTCTFSLSKEKVLPISFSTWGRHRDVLTRWPFKEGRALICRECSQQMTFTVSSFRSCLDTPVTQLPLGLIHVQKLSKSGIWKCHHFDLMGTKLMRVLTPRGLHNVGHDFSGWEHRFTVSSAQFSPHSFPPSFHNCWFLIVRLKLHVSYFFWWTPSVTESQSLSAFGPRVVSLPWKTGQHTYEYTLSSQLYLSGP